MTPALTASAIAAPAVPLGTADSFAVLAGSTITNTGSTTVFGDIGLCCTGVATTGFGPGADQVIQSGGAQYAGTGGVAATAQDDLDIAYADAAGRAVTSTGGVDLSLRGTPADPLIPGVYQSIARGALQINSGLTLDFQGDPNAVFIFQGTSLVTASDWSGSVHIVNGGAGAGACNVFWQLSDATQGVTLGTGSAFKGTTMSLGASVLGTAATVEGRVLTRRDKAVNLDTNTITRPACATGVETGGDDTPAPAPDVAAALTPTPTPAGAATSVPVGALAPPPLRAGPAAITPVSGVAATVAAITGAASLSGPTAPVTGPFAVVVTGRNIASVVFSVDGKRRATVHAKPGRKKFKLTINPRRQSYKVHRVTARVTYRAGSGSSSTTRRLVYRRADTSVHVPRFAG